jgi:hypothetical protein
VTEQPTLPFENSEPGLGSLHRRPRSGAGGHIPNTSSDRGARVGPEPDRADTPAGTESDTARVAPPFENRLGPSHHNAPETSGQAAVANYPRSGTQRAKVLVAIAFCSVLDENLRARGFRFGATDDEIANAVGLVGNSVRPRRIELVRDGLVEDSGKRRSSNMGHPAVVWTLTEEGLRAAKELTDG